MKRIRNKILCSECGIEALAHSGCLCRACYEAKYYNRLSHPQKLASRNYIKDGIGIITDSKGKIHEVTLEEFGLVKDFLWHRTSRCAVYNGKTLYSFLGRVKQKKEKIIK